MALLLIIFINQNEIIPRNGLCDVSNGGTIVLDIQNRETSSAKIDPLLVRWQNTTNPQEFAEKNNLTYLGDKIAVYIYLDRPDSVSKIPSDVEIRSSNANIVVAMVTSQQINQLSNESYVMLVSPPIRPVLYQHDENLEFPLFTIVSVVVIALAFVLFVILRKRSFAAKTKLK